MSAKKTKSVAAMQAELAALKNKIKEREKAEAERIGRWIMIQTGVADYNEFRAQWNIIRHVDEGE